jgi:hypothetical protein
VAMRLTGALSSAQPVQEHGPPRQPSRVGRAVLLAVLLTAVLALPIGFFWQGFVKRHHGDGVPASAFPDIVGVTVVSSEVPVPVEWQDAGSGNRSIVVTTPGARGAPSFALVVNGLTASGWAQVPCHNGPGRSGCFQNSEFWAIVQYPSTPHTNRLNVRIERAPCTGWFC